MRNISRNSRGKTPNVLCLASCEKRNPFLKGSEMGVRAYLVNSGRLRHVGWSRGDINGIRFMPADQSEWNLGHMPVALAPELIEESVGVNLWTEWAKLDNSIITGPLYSAPEVRNEYAGLLVSLARQEWLDTSVVSDPEVVRKLAKRHHAGLVMRSPHDRRVAQVTDSYTDFVRKDFHATPPPQENVGY